MVEYARAGVSVGLGTDGFGPDMLGELTAASLLCRHSAQDAEAGFEELPRALFESNAAFAGRIFGTELGVLRPGAAGDVIVLDYAPPTPLTAHDLDAHLIAASGLARVTSTVSAGKLLMQDRVLLVVDEEKLLEGARKQAADLWRRVNA